MHLRNIKLKGSAEELRSRILQNFLQTYELYETLFELLKDDSVFYEQPEKLRHPLLFYFGHTATFYINKLIISQHLKKGVNLKFESMFAIGVDEMSWDDLNTKHYDWPDVKDVKEYRNDVKNIVVKFIKNAPLDESIGWDDPLWVIVMGIEHERIHLETSSVLIRQLEIGLLRTHPSFKPCSTSSQAPKNTLKEVPEGEIIVEKPLDDIYYGWDNEYGKHTNYIDSFQASEYLVSNAEFMEFVTNGGYENETYWSDEGNRWRDFKKAKHPPFWIKSDNGFKFRNLNEVIDLPLNWPVEVNFLEAEAFCRFKSEKIGKELRLPSEDEWIRLRDFCAIDHEKTEANINLEHYASSMPVNSFEHNGFYDVIGNVWQWSATPIYPYEGFKVHPYYDDFSTPTFDNRHNLIKGGSWISTGNETSRYSRYAFRRHFYQHAGFRYVHSFNEIKSNNDQYETDNLVSQYCEFHYGKEYFSVENFPSKMAKIALKYATNKRKALDIGCAVGRATYELAREFDFVTGIDFSARFIRQAIDLKEKGNLKYILPVEGELLGYSQVTLESLALKDLAKKVQFWQGDAHNLKPQFKGYDLILALNLIDRLYNPRKFLEEIHRRMNKDGILVLSSPYTWLEEYTKKENWLGGYKKDGEIVKSSDTIQQILSKHFTLLEKPFKVDFVIRETANKFQHTWSEVLIFKRL